MSLLKKITFSFVLLSFAFALEGFAQEKKIDKFKGSKKTKKVNFGYSTNPPAKKAKKTGEKNNEIADNSEVTNKESKTTEDKTAVTPKSGKASATLNSSESSPAEKKELGISSPEEEIKNKTVSIANKTREVAKEASKANLSPTEYYKVGVGDVLYINLQDENANYYTVLIDGTIDYPLAGKLVSVIDLTTEEIEDLLREKIKLYERPQITVKVREFISHKINVAGLARKGKHFLQREAMPLVVIKTMVGVKSDADTVIIERFNEKPKTIALNSEEANTFLIVKDDKLTFEKSVEAGVETADNLTNQYYFLGEEVCEGGKKKYHNGITLVQAVFDACGGINTKLKEISIIRKTDTGKFVSTKYNFKDILSGKQTDPKLLPNDMIDAEK